MSFTQFSKKQFRKRKKVITRVVVGFFVVAGLLVLLSSLLGGSIIDHETYTPRESVSLNTPFVADLTFNTVGETEAFKEVFFDSIRSANENIYVAMYSLSDPESIRLLDDQKKHGVNVEVIVPKSKGNQHQLAFALTDIVPLEIGSASSDSESNDSSMNGELMHHKFLVIDPGTDNEQVVVSSANLTNIQQEFDPSFVLSTTDSYVVNHFLHEFSLLKNKTHGLKKLTSGEFQPMSFKGEYSNGLVELWFGPGYMKNAMKQRLLDEIAKAELSVKVLGWRVNDQDIARALAQKIAEGISVNVIVDDYYLWDDLSSMSMLRELDANVVVSDAPMNLWLHESGLLDGQNVRDDFNSFLHHHTIIIDDTLVMTGTNNWTKGGFFYNDESAIVTTVPELVEAYINQFDVYLSQFRGVPLLVSSVSDTEFALEVIPDGTQTIVVYKEESNPLWVGEVCHTSTPEEPIVVSPSCLTERTRVFALDAEYRLIGSDYLLP